MPVGDFERSMNLDLVSSISAGRLVDVNTVFKSHVGHCIPLPKLSFDNNFVMRRGKYWPKSAPVSSIIAFLDPALGD